MRKLLSVATIVGVLTGLLISAPGSGALGAPPTNPAVTAATYAGAAGVTPCFRVFSDPHAFWPAPAQPVPAHSPYAKGAAACAATDFYNYNDVFVGNTLLPSGMAFLESLFPRFIEFYNLEQDFGVLPKPACANSTDLQDYCSAGLPRQGTPTDRVKSDLFIVRVTDESVPEANKKFFAFPLSIHGIERAGAEAGVRAAEDLATWGYCENQHTTNPNGVTTTAMCAQEGIPHPLLETRPAGPDNLTAGDVLEQASIYFVFANADGWRRGDTDNAIRFFQRYNGNGVDLNRDWPTQGFTHRPYTPWSEPETRSFGKVLRQIKPNWAGGIDLHGQLSGRAFSFTLLGAGEHDYAKDQRILQVVKGAWTDAETRLGWHPQVIPNTDPPPSCSALPTVGNVCPTFYGVQWGTVWDTINYQITGGFGDWIDNPAIGLGGDGIDNEMSFSHLSNCGVGSCYLIDYEQLHVDGNKSLVGAMVNYTLLPENTQFVVPGKVGYIFDPTVLSNPGSTTPTPPPGLSPQPNQTGILLTPSPMPENNYVHRFTVFGPDSTPTPYYNGGLEGKVTLVNIGGISPGTATSSLVLEYLDPELGGATNTACNTANDKWNEVNTYFNQSVIYLQGGMAVHANQPEPGDYRVCMTGGLTTAAANAVVELDVNFSTEKAWEDPGQLPYSVTNMEFFRDLAPHMNPGQLVQVNVPNVLSGAVNLDQFSSLVIADNPAPGLTDPSPELTAYKDKLLSFVQRGGNLVLTDGALKLLGTMGFVTPSNVARNHFYAGFMAFTTNGGSNDTYGDPLAFNINQPGAAEGSGHRHQTYEPVPLGFDIGSRQSCGGEPPPPPPPGQTQTVNTCTSPHWTVLQSGAGSWGSPLQGTNSRTVAQTVNGRTVLGELKYGCGRVRIAGALLPMPVERYYHPFGLANYAATYSGYQVLKNVLQWTRPRRTTRQTTSPC